MIRLPGRNRIFPKLQFFCFVAYAKYNILYISVQHFNSNVTIEKIRNEFIILGFRKIQIRNNSRVLSFFQNFKLLTN